MAKTVRPPVNDYHEICCLGGEMVISDVCPCLYLFYTRFFLLVEPLHGALRHLLEYKFFQDVIAFVYFLNCKIFVL